MNAEGLNQRWHRKDEVRTIHNRAEWKQSDICDSESLLLGGLF